MSGYEAFVTEGIGYGAQFAAARQGGEVTTPAVSPGPTGPRVPFPPTRERPMNRTTKIAGAIAAMMLCFGGGVAVSAVPNPDPCDSLNGKAFQKCRFDRLENKGDQTAAKVDQLNQKIDALTAKLGALTGTGGSTPSPTPSPSPTPPTSTTPTPSTSATPTPTPSPTSSPTPGAACTNPTYTTSSPDAGRSFGAYYVHNNMWNAGGYDVSQTLRACSAQSWNGTTTADNSTGDGAVKTYPNVHKDYHNWSTGAEPRVSGFSTLRSTFAGRGPGVGIYNVAYDIWLNGVPGNREIMIWTENQGQRPAGSRIGSVVVDGRSWDFWATGSNGILTFVAPQDIPSGALDLKAFLGYLTTQGRIPATSTLGQICFGVEVVSTGGSPARFDFTDFSVTDAQ